jgi:sodium transport system permease protein
MIEQIGVVFQKELRDNLRDRRSLTMAIISAFIGPFILVAMFTFIGQINNQQAEEPLELSLVGAENAPALVNFLQQNNVDIQPAPLAPQTAVRDGTHDLVLIIPEGYGDSFTAGLPATVQLISDQSRQASRVPVERAMDLLEAYDRQMGALRLQARGVSPGVVTPLTIEDVDVSTPQSRVALLLNILPYFILFAIFLGGMSIITDTISGERERGSLEPLLINPLSRAEFVLGKMGAALVITILNVLLTLIGFAAVFNLAPLGESLGIRLSLDPLALAVIFFIVLPIAVLATALQTIIAAFSRTVKEAQSYLGLLPLLPAAPGLLLAFSPLEAELWTMLIPTFGQQLLINQLMRGESVSLLNVLVSVIMTLLVGVVLIWVAVRLFGREDMLFRR